MLDKYIRLLDVLDEGLLLEMAISRKDALLTCQSLGEEILEHFLKCIEEGVDDISFKHHCNEIYGWFSKVDKLVLKDTKKKLSNEQLREWCFYRLSEPEFLINDPEFVALYIKFTDLMLRYRNSGKLVSEIFYELLF